MPEQKKNLLIEVQVDELGPFYAEISPMSKNHTPHAFLELFDWHEDKRMR